MSAAGPGRWLSDRALAHLREVADRPDLAGTRYELIEALGRGGMATVYRARDRALDREVALKVMDLPEGAGGEAERLLAEARILARLEHPGLVPVHDAGTLADGRAFYAMKRVRGERLDAYAAGAGRAERLRVFERICEAVAFAHAHGVIHRDLKPENVMVGPFGEVLVLDWGVAKLRAAGGGGGAAAPAADGPSPSGRAGAAAETGHGTILGTPGYMAPEQARGEVLRIDERADVYALGAILDFLLAGGAGGESAAPVPRPLAAIRGRAMAAEPEDRYPGVRELAADLARYLAGLSVEAHRESALERAGRFARRHRVAILLVLSYLLMRVLLLVLA